MICLPDPDPFDTQPVEVESFDEPPLAECRAAVILLGLITLIVFLATWAAIRLWE